MSMNQTRTKERRFVYIQCKIPTGWRSVKFRYAGSNGLRHPSSLGARPHPWAPVPSGAEAD
jgi:hypothetical protein